ncbi:MAG: ABC transporter permease, partial [Firmicutes bacterium]|nr:ABC transporter permease [Bacillota bacterium]
MNIRITKRSDMPKKQEIIIRIAAVLLSIVFAGLILVIFGLNPIKIFSTIIKGSLGTKIRIQQTIIRAIPLTITALGIT